MLFATPILDPDDTTVLNELEELRRRLAESLRTPRRWEAGLRRSMLARLTRGSNAIEGYDVEVDDAAAALDGEPALTAPDPAFAEIRGYRDALGYVLAVADDPYQSLDPSTLRALHYMLLGHDPSKSPGRYRPGPALVLDRHGETVYQGPDAAQVPGLVDELMTRLEERRTRTRPVVLAAMAHLNLAMIHPFRDGNGRTARLLQTFVLARNGIDPALSGIEEWLGEHPDAYYRLLVRTGGPTWNPTGDAQLWMKFCLRAQHLQAQATAARFEDAVAVNAALDHLIAETALPTRVADELFDACLGFRLRRSTYVKRAGIQQRTATRDLARLVDLELLSPRGETRGRHYVAGPQLEDLRAAAVAPPRPVTDPYPGLDDELLAAPSPEGAR
jgi:Fic family protein